MEAELKAARGKWKKVVKEAAEVASNLIHSMQTISIMQNPCTSFKELNKLRQVLSSGDPQKLKDYIEQVQNDDGDDD